MRTLLVEFGWALALTIAIELAVVALLGVRTSREFAAVVLVNVITNPSLNCALLLVHAGLVSALRPGLAGVAEWTFVIVAEVVVVLVEWKLLAWALRADSRTWLVRSATMNAASFVVGTWLLALVLPTLVR